MGKISKALDKAEKGNASKPAPDAKDKRVRAHIDTKSSIPTSKLTMRSDHQHLKSEPPARRKVQVEPPSDNKQPKRLEKRTTVISSSTASPTAESIDRRSTRRSEQGPLGGSNKSEVKSQQPPFEAESAKESAAYPKPDSVNIALVRKDAPESPASTQRMNREIEVEQRHIKTSRPAVKTSGREVRVRYSRTKVQINDPQKLKSNRIFSVFDDMETTTQFKILRTQVLKKLKTIGGNSILVTSANPYEGKTFTSINLGVSIAKEFDRTVLIIDADLRKPTRQHTDFSTEFFSLSVEMGLTDYLEGNADIEDILINPGIDKLTLIPAGSPVSNSAELLNSARMEEMMSEIKNRYPSDRLVIVDGPSILHFPDAMILYRHVDGVLPVVEVEKTSTEDLKKMVNHLEEANILGFVLNKNKE